MSRWTQETWPVGWVASAALEEYLTNGLDAAENSLVLETNKTLESESQGLSKKFHIRFVQAEPFL